MLKRLIGAVIVAFISNVALADHVPGHVTIAGKQYWTGYKKAPSDTPKTFYSPAFEAGDLPDSYDSRIDGLIPDIRDQKQCGSCWDFAMTGAFETGLIRAGKADQSINLSEQDFLKNGFAYGHYGCEGGFMDARFLQEAGEATEADCPYKANDSVACSKPKFAKASSWALLGSASKAPTVDELRAGIIKYGSLFVTVAAGGGFNPVAGRIATCSSSSINHMVQLVAYQPAPSGGYEFLIKNSWGTSWGNGGFAWSKQGCNKLASDPGDAAGFVYTEGETPPVPTPTKLDLPIEVVVNKGHEVALQVRPLPGVKYKWSTGATGARIYVIPSGSTSYTLTATDAEGATSQAVKVTVK